MGAIGIFFIGAVFGGMVGFFTAGLCISNRRPDEMTATEHAEELRKFCRYHQCSECIFYENMSCRLQKHTPMSWKLEEPEESPYEKR